MRGGLSMYSRVLGLYSRPLARISSHRMDVDEDVCDIGKFKEDTSSILIDVNVVMLGKPAGATTGRHDGPSED